MFNNSKYTTWYRNIITRAQYRSKPRPAENHHIIPKSMGGTETVALTPREHFICHLLLPKMLAGKEQKQMLWGLHRMIHSESKGQQRYVPSSRIYELFRKQFVEMVSKPKELAHREKLAAHLTAINKDPAIIERKRQKRLNVPLTEQHRDAISRGAFATMNTAEVKEKLKVSSKKRWSDPNERAKIANKISKTFQLTNKETGESIIVKNLAQFCRDNKTYHRKVHLEFYVTEII